MSTPTVVATPVPGYRDWRGDAACQDVDPELFFPDGDVKSVRTQVAMAKLICRRCLVSATCLSWALASGQEAGIWGGLTEAERHRLLRRTRPGSIRPASPAASAPVRRPAPTHHDQERLAS